MMYRMAILFLCCATALPSWAEQPPKQTGTDPAVLAELSWHSGIRPSELDARLANCHADQDSLYLCAWRDSIVADRAFADLMAQRIRQRPRCRPALEKRVGNWQRRRDAGCARSAERQWGNGPFAKTAKLKCVQDETERQTSRLARARGCNLQ